MWIISKVIQEWYFSVKECLLINEDIRSKMKELEKSKLVK